ncbi:MAG: flagellar assembly protein A, partial [Cellulosilyticaceae bacterium]
MEKNSTLPLDEKINVEISPDKMFGVMVFTQPEHEGRKLTEEEIKMAIDEKGIKYGIDEVLLKEICTERKYNYKYFIAKGKAPTIGQNAVIDYQFNVEVLQKIIPTLKEDGSVDFKNLNIMNNVKRDDVLAIKVSPKVGEDGYNIFGE